MKIVLATGNSDKIREIKRILNSKRLIIYSKHDFKRVPRVKEDGRTFEQNAIKKAKAFAKAFKLPAIADDSGLEVEALNGNPGIRSARFAGGNSTKEKLCRKVLRLMSGIPASGRGARFVCSVALALPGNKIYAVNGYVYGKIADRMKGENGFGYDPIFIPNGHNKTFAEMSPSMKDQLSHRARAVQKIKDVIKRLSLV